MDADEKILRSAGRLLERYGGFTMDRLALEAGISRAALLRRFPRKSKLLARLEQGGQVRPDRRALARRERILQAARRLVAQQGRDSATVDAVAAAAGVAPATIVDMFGDRQALLSRALGEPPA